MSLKIVLFVVVGFFSRLSGVRSLSAIQKVISRIVVHTSSFNLLCIIRVPFYFLCVAYLYIQFFAFY